MIEKTGPNIKEMYFNFLSSLCQCLLLCYSLPGDGSESGLGDSESINSLCDMPILSPSSSKSHARTAAALLSNISTQTSQVRSYCLWYKLKALTSSYDSYIEFSMCSLWSCIPFLE